MATHLTHDSDWKQVAELLAEVGAAESLLAMVEVFIRRAHDLFPAELVICDRFDNQARQLAFQMYPAPSEEFLRRAHAPFLAFWHQHPFFPDWAKTVGGGRPAFLSDRISGREFRKTGLWNEVYIHLRAKNQILLGGPTGPGRFWCLSLNRLGSNFGSRERELCLFLQPRITALFQKQSQREQASQAAELIAHGETAYVVVDATGTIIELSTKAAKLLVATPWGWGKSIPHLAAGHRSTRPAGTQSWHALGNALWACVMRPLAGGNAFVILNDSPKAEPGAVVVPGGDLSPSPQLTAREAEVFHWLGQGKTNAEIGIILGISLRTVQKHCEWLFEKLGVENRLAAALLARKGRGD